MRRFAAFSLLLVVAVVWTVSRSSSEEDAALPVELGSREYHVWLHHIGFDSSKLDDSKSAINNRHSLAKIHAMLRRASTKLSSEIGALRQMQDDSKKKKLAEQQARAAAQKKQDKMPKGFSANAIADALSSKLKAYEEVREKAARYLLKDIAKTIVSSLDKGKISIKPDAKAAAAAAAKKSNNNANQQQQQQQQQQQKQSKADRRREERKRRRRERRRERRQALRRLVRAIALQRNAPNHASHDRKYEVNKGRYVVVVNQRNIDSRSGPVQVQKTADRSVDDKKNKKNNKGDKKNNNNKGGDKKDGKNKAATKSDNNKKDKKNKKKLSSAEKAKFKAQDRVDRRLQRIAEIAMDSVRRLSLQRKELREMRRARRRIVKEVSRPRREKKQPTVWKKEVHIQAPIIVMSRDGNGVLDNADAAVSAATKANTAADKASAQAAAQTKKIAKQRIVQNGKQDKKKGVSSDNNKNNNNNKGGDIHVHGPLVVINAAKKQSS